jgi:hypothetical protein
LKWKKVRYRTFYCESIILLTLGLLGWTVLALTGELFDKNGIFTLLTGSLFPIQSIDLIFLGLGLVISTALLDFLTKFYHLNREGLIAILPWAIVGQYRYLHEFVWVYQYWITANVLNGKFSDTVAGLWGGNWSPALLTHLYSLLFIVFTMFNFIVILYESRKKREKCEARGGSNHLQTELPLKTPTPNPSSSYSISISAAVETL